jgi:ABC-2 type transport system permease protein
MQQIRLIGLFLRLGIMNEMQYRANFFTQIFQSALGLVVSIGGLAVVFAQTDNLNGWKPNELLAVVGVYFLIGGVINLVIQPSMNRLMEDVRMGTLDYVLTKPEDAQLMVSVREIQMWRIIDVFIGFGVLVVALVRLGAQIGWQDALAFFAVMISGTAIVYSFWLILAATAFWFVRIDNVLYVFETLYQTGRWPVRIYPGWMQFMLTFLVPVAFAVTVPVEALTGRLTTPTLALALGMGIGTLIAARLVWQRALKAYSGASA